MQSAVAALSAQDPRHSTISHGCLCRFCCALNSAIHVFMYGYYTWAALGVRSHVVKQMVTMSQMVQFVALISQVPKQLSLLLTADCQTW